MSNTLRLLSVACSALVVTSFVGCGPGGPDIAGVEGTVTMDGQPLANATVVFVPEVGGRPSGSSTDESGHYELNFSEGRQGAIPGKNKVMISTLSDPYEDEDGNPVPGRPETIPVKYNVETELFFDVVDGKRNVADFALESGGEVRNEVDDGY